MREIKVYTKEELKTLVPAAFSQTPAKHVSNRYRFLNTESVVDYAMEHGLVPVAARQSHTKINTPEYGQHLVSLQPANSIKSLLDVNDRVLRVGIYNSHNATSAIRILVQIYRCVCANQMTVTDSSFAALRVPHLGDPEQIKELIATNLATAIQRGKDTLANIERYTNIELDEDTQRGLASVAVAIRWPNVDLSDVDEQVKRRMRIKVALQPRRHTDQANDAWTVYNRIQENIVKGRHKRWFMGIKSVKGDIDFNQQFWKQLEALAA